MLCGGKCGGMVGNVHKCPTYGVHMHVFCGRPIGDEGFNQSVLCPDCNKLSSAQEPKKSHAAGKPTPKQTGSGPSATVRQKTSRDKESGYFCRDKALSLRPTSQRTERMDESASEYSSSSDDEYASSEYLLTIGAVVGR